VTVTGTTDGRVARGARNRDALVEALLALLREGARQPRAREIAERAGLSLRTVFQHFADLDSLYGSAADHQAAHLAARFAPLPREGPTADRIAALVARRAELYEEIAPVRRASLRVAPSSPVLTARLADTAARLRREITRVLAPELAATDGRRRADVLAALDLMLSWEAWDELRRVQGASVATARRVTALLVERLLRPG
jgi:TetR/AcrR family transcriptional regulator, regulator of autoinduction and epiphytic fitness